MSSNSPLPQRKNSLTPNSIHLSRNASRDFLEKSQAAAKTIPYSPLRSSGLISPRYLASFLGVIVFSRLHWISQRRSSPKGGGADSSVSSSPETSASVSVRI